MQICTRRLWPSETLCMRHSGSMSSTCITLARLAGSTPGRLLIICEAGMSPCSTQTTTHLDGHVCLKQQCRSSWHDTAYERPCQADGQLSLSHHARLGTSRHTGSRCTLAVKAVSDLQGYAVAGECYVAVPVAA